MHFEIIGLTSSMSGQPYANTEGYPGKSVLLGKELGKPEVNMAMARAEAVPLIAHNVIHTMLENNPELETQEELNLYAALLFTHAKAPVQIQHTHPQSIINALHIEKTDLVIPKGLVKAAIIFGLIWSIDRLVEGKKPKDRDWLVKNLGLMHDMTRLMDRDNHLAVNFEVHRDTLVLKQ